MKPKLTAKQVAFADIAAECKRQKEGRNYVMFEKDICESLGIKGPDYRQFNGGHNRKPLRIYVTFYTTAGKDYAIICGTEEEVDECICELMVRSGIKNIRVNRCGSIRNKNVRKITFKEFRNGTVL